MVRTKKFIVHPTDDKLAQFPPEVRTLVKKGRQQGFVTQQELMKAVPNVEDDLLLLDEIYSLFLDLGIDVIDVKDAMIWKNKEELGFLERLKNLIQIEDLSFRRMLRGGFVKQ